LDRIFGKKINNEFGEIYDEKYPHNNVFMKGLKKYVMTQQ
jgi:hypothetical protein